MRTLFRNMTRERMAVCTVAAALAIGSSGCKREPDSTLTLNAEVLHAYDDAMLNEMDLELEQRLLQNGVLNGNYQSVGSATTNEMGVAAFLFDRSNALDYRINLVEEDWFEHSELINPDDFIGTNEVNLSIAATPRGTVHIQLINAAPVDESDQIQFRLLTSESEYPTCSNAWESHTGMDVNAERTCDIEADRYLPYRHIVFKNGGELETTDSIWVPRGILTELVIPW